MFLFAITNKKDGQRVTVRGTDETNEGSDWIFPIFNKLNAYMSDGLGKVENTSRYFIFNTVF